MLLLTYLSSDNAPTVAQTAGDRLRCLAPRAPVLRQPHPAQHGSHRLARAARLPPQAPLGSHPSGHPRLGQGPGIPQPPSLHHQPAPHRHLFLLRYCQQHQIDPQPVPDPAHGVPRLKDRQYASSNYLGLDELHALLNAIDKDASILGKRDYALLLTLLATGLDYEIALMRIVIRNTFELSDDATSVAESTHCLDVLGMAATRLAKLFKVRHSLRQSSSSDDSHMQTFLKLAKKLEE